MAILIQFVSKSLAEQHTSQWGNVHVDNASYHQSNQPTGMLCTVSGTKKSTNKSTNVSTE